MTVTAGRSARGEINRLPCVFAAALNARCAVCSLAANSGPDTLCTQPVARAHCAQLDGLLRENARFIAKARANPLSTPAAGQTKSTSLRIQCGGLQGLGQLLMPDDVSVDVYRLLETALTQRGALESLPFEQLLPAIARWHPRA